MFSFLAVNLLGFLLVTNFLFAGNFYLSKMLADASFLKPLIAQGSREVMGIKVFRPEASAQERLPVNEDKNYPLKKSNIADDYFMSSQSGAVFDVASSSSLFEKEADQRRSLASITKLMTALVFLEHNPGWEGLYKIKPEDKVEGGRIYLFTGETIKIRDLFYSSLVASDNIATLALAKSTGLSESEFVARMNEKAAQLDLLNTNFKDPIGLSDANISTAKEIAKLASVALADKDISEATLKKKHEFNTVEGRKKIAYNTDDLLNIFPQNGVRIMGGKTGFTETAGYCFVGKFMNHEGHEIISVVLGAPAHSYRFKETHDLVNWIFENFIWSNNF